MSLRIILYPVKITVRDEEAYMSVKKTNILPGEKMPRCALACVAGGLRRVATPLPFVTFLLFLSLSAKIQYGAHNLRG